YLASLSQPTTAVEGNADRTEDAETVSGVSVFGTISPVWRGGGGPGVQNNQFFPDMIGGGHWQGKVLSERAVACAACHGTTRFELYEAAVKVDLATLLTETCPRDWQMSVDAGRFVVPFGAFSAQTNPGVYRTVSTPLIFNMGQRLFNQDLGFPVLPMPYADEGINLNVDVPLGDCGTGPITATMDAYLVNGLEGSNNGVDFLQSRDLFDNNNRVAGGGRVTVGDPYIRS